MPGRPGGHLAGRLSARRPRWRAKVAAATGDQPCGGGADGENPDRDLRRLAQERDWPVRDFARPVRLRPRWEPRSLSTRASMITHVAGVLAVGGTAAWLVARRGPHGARDS